MVKNWLPYQCNPKTVFWPRKAFTVVHFYVSTLLPFYSNRESATGKGPRVLSKVNHNSYSSTLIYTLNSLIPVPGRVYSTAYTAQLIRHSRAKPATPQPPSMAFDHLSPDTPFQTGRDFRAVYERMRWEQLVKIMVRCSPHLDLNMYTKA